MPSYDPLAHFQNRTGIIAAFDSLWDDDHPMVIQVYGFSGYGKTTLIRWLQKKRCETQAMPYASVDFDRIASVLQPLDGIIRDLRAVLPPAAYRQYQHSSEKIQQEVTDRSRIHIDIRQQQDKGEHNTQIVNSGLAEYFADLERNGFERLTTGWLECLSNLRCDRWVIFLDSYETYQDNNTQMSQNILWRALSDAYRDIRGLRIFVGSDRYADLSIPSVFEQQLEAFNQQDSDALLLSMGVQDAPFCAAVYNRLAKGHPLITEYAGNLWMDAARKGSTLDTDEIQDVAELEKAVAWIQGKIINHLAEPLKSAVRWTALLRRFNLEAINATLPLNNAKIDVEQFEQLCRYAFVQKAGDYWTCHELLRRVQSGYLRQTMPQAFIDFHRQAGDYFRGKDNIEALYHRFFCDRQAAFDEWAACEETATLQFNRSEQERLLMLADSNEFKLSSLQHAEVIKRFGRKNYWIANFAKAASFYEEALAIFRTENDLANQAECVAWLGDIHKGRGELNEARQHYEEALFIWTKQGDALGAARNHIRLGKVLLLLDEYRDAQAQLEEALPIFQTAGSALGEADCLFALGDVCRLTASSGQVLGKPSPMSEAYGKAREYYERSAALYESIHYRFGQASVLTGLGHVNNWLGNHDQAFGYFKHAQDIQIEIGNRLGEADATRNLGNTSYFQDNLPQAQACFEKSLGILRKIGARRDEAYCIADIADNYYRRDQYSQAGEYYGRALEILEGSGDRRGQARCIRSLGEAIYQQGEYDKAQSYAERAEEIFRVLGNRVGEANCKSNIGNCYWMKDQYENALEHYSSALAIHQAVGNRSGVARCFKDLGEVYYLQDKYDDAKANYEAALAIFESPENRTGKAGCFADIGDVHYARDEYTEALAMYERASELYKATDDRFWEASCFIDKGEVFVILEKYPEALQCYENAFEYFSSIDSPGQKARCLRALGGLRFVLKEYAEAERLLSEAKAIYRDLEDDLSETGVRESLGQLYSVYEDYDRALEEYQYALETADRLALRSTRAAALNDMGTVCRTLGDYARAKICYEESIQIFKQLGDRLNAARTTGYLAQLLARMNEANAAKEYIAKCIELHDQIGYPTVRASGYAFAGDAYFELGDYDNAASAFTRALSGSATDADIYLAQSRICVEQLQLDRLEDLLSQVEKCMPNHPHLPLYRAQEEILLGNGKHALELIETALLQKGICRADAGAVKAVALVLLARMSEAVQAAEEASKQIVSEFGLVQLIKFTELALESNAEYSGFAEVLKVYHDAKNLLGGSSVKPESHSLDNNLRT